MCRLRRNRKTSGLLGRVSSRWLPGFDCGWQGSFDRLNVEDRGRLASGFRLGFTFGFGGGGLFLALHHAFDEEGDGAFALSGLAYFGAWGENT
jgi:hypothetical protein